MPRGALVVGGNYRALGVVRSLGRRGIPVWVVKDAADLLASTSRYVKRSLTFPVGDEQDRLAFLLDAEAKHNLGGWLLLPTEDDTARSFAENYRLLAERFTMTTPPWEQFRWTYDKRLTYALARDIQVACPWIIDSLCPEQLASLDCRFPVILKPAFRRTLNGATAPKAWRVDDRRSLPACYEEARKVVPPDVLMIQELIPGSGDSQLSYAGLFLEGRPLASLVARRLRQMPMDFGRFSTFVETADVPAVVEPATKLMAALHFTGVAEVEFKHDERDGQYKLLDINTRIWGWHTLCGRAGIDVPYLLWQMMNGETVPKVVGQLGVCWQWPSTDLPIVIKEIMQGRLSIRAYAQSRRGPVESAIFSSDDPTPGLLELPLMAYKLARRRLSQVLV
jgi:D-aspartate ligase